MDELYGLLLDLLPRLREAGHRAAASELLAALTSACTPLEVLDRLRGALAELPEDLDSESRALVRGLQATLEILWREQTQPRP
jgi:molecular chaperone GrpE (heat shock protein)